jgi:CSLREA domain-containing protein
MGRKPLEVVVIDKPKRRRARSLRATALRVGVTTALALLWIAPLNPAHAATFAVNSTADDPDANTNNSTCATVAGVCTLRAAIQQSNATPSVNDTINFNIQGAGPHTILPLSPLPTVTDNVVINAYSQPGAKTATSTVPATIMVQLDGTSAGPGIDGLEITSGNTTVRGLSIFGFGRFGVSIEGPSGANKIHGNYIGVDASGVTPRPNTWEGVSIFESKNNVIGSSENQNRNVIAGNGLTRARDGIEITGATSAANTVRGNYIGTDHTGTSALPNVDDGITIDGAKNNQIIKNVISGNAGDGILIHGGSATGNQIKGNLIGTDRTGTSAIPNRMDGVHIEGVKQNTVGGTSTDNRNVISGNVGRGVRIDASDGGTPATANKVLGNFIGTDKAGLAAIPNAREGLFIDDSANNTIGGTTTSSANVISGNAEDGVEVEGPPSTGNKIQGNFIGVTKTLAPLGNADEGVTIDDASNNTVGGTVAGAKNVIAHNVGTGVLVRSGNRNAIQRNLIHSNGLLGIDLAPLGSDANDLGDVDVGPNDFQNFAELTTAKFAGGVLRVDGALNSVPSKAYTVEFFANAQCDVSGSGEGERFVGASQLTTPANGTVSFSKTFSISVPVGQVVTATITDGAGNTSEFSQCVTVTA